MLLKINILAEALFKLIGEKTPDKSAISKAVAADWRPTCVILVLAAMVFCPLVRGIKVSKN